MSTYEWFTCFAALCLLVVIGIAFYDDYCYRREKHETTLEAMRRLRQEIREDYDEEDL